MYSSLTIHDTHVLEEVASSFCFFITLDHSFALVPAVGNPDIGNISRAYWHTREKDSVKK